MTRSRILKISIALTSLVVIAVVASAAFLTAGSSQLLIKDYSENISGQNVSFKVPSIAVVDRTDFLEDHFRIVVDLIGGESISIANSDPEWYSDRTGIEDPLDAYVAYRESVRVGGTWTVAGEQEALISSSDGLILTADATISCDYWVDVCEDADSGIAEHYRRLEAILVADGTFYEVGMPFSREKDRKTFSDFVASLEIS